MKRTHKVTLVIALLLSAHAYSGEENLPEPGPEKDGLRLRLVVENNPKTIDRHTINLEIINVSDKPITLVGIDEVGKKDSQYADYLQSVTKFDVYPRVLPQYFQINVSSDPARPTAIIEPGKSLIAKWELKGRRLTAYEVCWGIEFPTVGRFDVRADLLLERTEPGKPLPPVHALEYIERSQVHLWSNAQPFIVGGSTKAPKCCAAAVTKADAEKGTIYLDGCGTLNGIKAGDHFRIDMPMRARYDLEIVACAEFGAYAKMIGSEIDSYEEKKTPKFPEPGMNAMLLPEKE